MSGGGGCAIRVVTRMVALVVTRMFTMLVTLVVTRSRHPKNVVLNFTPQNPDRHPSAQISGFVECRGLMVEFDRFIKRPVA